jgi:hypothetical protein
VNLTPFVFACNISLIILIATLPLGAAAMISPAAALVNIITMGVAVLTLVPLLITVLKQLGSVHEEVKAILAQRERSALDSPV